MMNRVLSSFFLLSLVWILSANGATMLEFGQVQNFTLADGVESMSFEVYVPYNPVVPKELRTIILTYLPLSELNVSASFINPSPNYTNAEYVGFSKDGNTERGIVWINNAPLGDATLYVTVTRSTNVVEVDDFLLNVEYPQSLLNYDLGDREETIAEVKPGQTKWYFVEIVNQGEQFIGAFRAEFCDEVDGSVAVSVVFPETNVSDRERATNPCTCDDTFVEDRDTNVITNFGNSPSQMFILPEPAFSEPSYVSVFYGGPYDDMDGITTSYSRKTPCVERVAALKKRSMMLQSKKQQTPRLDTPPFAVKLTMWGQEMFPLLRTKIIKTDMVHQDIIANVEDTPYCDFWTSNNFTAYVSKVEYGSFDSACFLETHASLFDTYKPATLWGEKSIERTLIVRNFFPENHKNNGTFINFVHQINACGSYAYFHDQVPDEGWQLDQLGEKKEWAPAAIGLIVILGFLFVVFLITTIILVSRLRGYANYRNIRN